jgi:hypothetical protein
MDCFLTYEMALVKHPWTLVDIAGRKQGSTPLASSLQANKLENAFRLLARRLARHSSPFHHVDGLQTRPKDNGGIVVLELLLGFSIVDGRGLGPRRPSSTWRHPVLGPLVLPPQYLQASFGDAS